MRLISTVSFIRMAQGKEYSSNFFSLSLLIFLGPLSLSLSPPDAYECAKMLCEQYYLGAPELELRETNGERRRSSSTTVCFLFFFIPLTRSANRRFSSPPHPPLVPAANNAREPIYISYIPSHLYHMLFELFKVINQDGSLMRKDVEVWWLNFKSSGRFKAKKEQLTSRSWEMLCNYGPSGENI